MAVETKNYDTSTICDKLFKGWLDQYPTEKTNLLQTRYLALNNIIRDTTEKLKKLQTAEARINELTTTLSILTDTIKKADSIRLDFIRDFGDLGVKCSKGAEELTTAVSCGSQFLSEYDASVRAKFFSNLNDVQKTLEEITALRDMYQNLFSAIVTIRDVYFKTEPSRRKPVIRDLYRYFSKIGDESAKIPIPLANQRTKIIEPMFTSEEFENFKVIQKECRKTAELIKKCR